MARADRPEARHGLTEAAKDHRGTVTMTKHFNVFELPAHGIQLVEGNDPRLEARYREAVNYLVSRRLLEPRGDEDEVFGLTNCG